MTDLMKLFAEMDSMGVEELMRQSWQRAFGIMRLLKRDGKFCDVTLHCEMAAGANRNPQSPPLGLVAHKVVLVSWSGYFRNLMDVGLFEEVEVMVPGVSHRALSWLLDLMYGETEPAVNEDNVDTIFQAAMILQVPLAVSLCAQMMKQRRRGALIGDIVSSTIPEVDSRASPARVKQTNIDVCDRLAPSAAPGLPTLQRAVKVEPPPPTQDCQSSSSSQFFPKASDEPDQRDDGRISSHKYDENRYGHDSDGDDCLDSNSNQRHNSGSPYHPYEVAPSSLVATSPKRQIISATRTPIFKPKSRHGPRPIAAKTNSSQDHFRQPPATSLPNTPPTSQMPEPPPLPPPAPQAPTLFVPMPTLTSTSVSAMPSASAAFPTGMIGAPGLSMAALGALQLAPILVSSSSAPPSHVSTSPEGDAEGDEGRLIINEDDHDTDDHKGIKGLKVRSKRQKVSGMEMVPVADDSMDSALVHHTPKGNLTIVAICNICQKGFTSKTGYKKHIRTHMGAFPYHCPVCNKGYFDHYTLQEHLNAHKGLKVHGCSGCGKKYQRKKNLVIHQRSCNGVPESMDVDIKEDASTPEGSDVRVLSDGPWSENGSESLHEDDDRVSMGDEKANVLGHEDLNGGAGGSGERMEVEGKDIKTTPGFVKEEDEEEDDGVVVAESEGKGMIILNPTKRDPSPSMISSAMTASSSASTSGYPVLLPKGTLIKQLLKQESQSPALARQHLQQLQQYSLNRQHSSTQALDERPKSVSAFATAAPAAVAGPVAARTSNMSEGPPSPASLQDGKTNSDISPMYGASSANRLTSESASTVSHGSTDEPLSNGAPTSGKEKFQCPHCSEIVTGRKNLQDHLAKVHSQPDKFTCPTCGRIFKYMTSLAHHIQTVCHDLNATESTTSTSKTTAAPKTTTMITVPTTTTTSGVIAGTKSLLHSAENLNSQPPPTPPSTTPPPSACSSDAQTSPLTPSRKSRRISKRNSGGGPGLDICEGESDAASKQGSDEGGDTEKKGTRRVLQMKGEDGGELAGGYVILNEET